VLEGVPPRPDNASNTTGGGGNEPSGDLSSDDGTEPNPCQGRPLPDGTQGNRRSMPLRHGTTCATWNIRGMTQGKLNVITKEMGRCGVNILGVSEHWMLSQGRFVTDDGFVVFFSGKDEGRRSSGVGFVVDKDASKAVLGYNPIDDRVMTIRIKGHPMNITFLQAYAPTADAEDEVVDDFYNKVQEALDQIHRKDIVIIMGDWNAKIGGNIPRNKYIGNHGIGIRNERGDRLAEFCMTNDLVLTNTTFKHHPRRLYTWSSPGDRTRNQIDYIMVPKRWQSSIQNVKTRPGADCGSDHQMLYCKMKLKMKSMKRMKAPVRYDVFAIPEDFKVEVSNKFEALMALDDTETSSEELWEQMKSTMQIAANNHVPKRRKMKRQWLKPETMEVAEERRNAKTREDNEEWRRLDKLFTQKANEDMNQYLEEKCMELERSSNNPRRVFQLVKEITRKHDAQMDVINDKDGNALTEEAEIKRRWAEYCEELYRKLENDTEEFQTTEYETEPPPLREEVKHALNKMSNGKSTGIDDIPAELWKASGEKGIDLLWKLCNHIWKSQEWPTDWCRAVFLPIYKKGSKKECSNYRTISLISHASKILLRIIVNRIKHKYTDEISDEQAGFVEGRGTREHIVNVRQIMEKCKGHNIPLYMCFIDYSKAFDCVSHGQLWNIMKTMGFPLHIISLISKLYENQESAVRTYNGNTEWFKIGRGVRQGCILSPCLYNLYAEDIMRVALEEKDWGVKIGGVKRSNLRYADDTTLLASSKEELMNMISDVKEASKPRGLLLNVKKTQVMVVDNSRTDNSAFVLDGEEINEVDEFIYLGSKITKDCSSKVEIRRRLAMARATTINMTTVWKSKGISTKLKTRLLRATSFAIASYGCESWAMTQADKKRMDAFEMWAYRRVLRVSWTARKTNKWVLEKIGNGLMLRKEMMKRKMKFFGHAMRHESFEKSIIQGAVEARRRRGRPQREWMEDIKTWTGLDGAAACTVAQDRRRWQKLMRITAARIAPSD